MLYSRHSDAVQRFFRDVLELKSEDAGESWPIFAAPPAELAVHPTEGEPQHEIFLICDNVHAMVAKLAERGVQTEGIEDRRWGLATTVILADGERIALYEPHHPSPLR